MDLESFYDSAEKNNAHPRKGVSVIMKEYVKTLKSFHSLGQPLDEVIDTFIDEMDNFFQKIENVSGSWEYLAEEKRKVFPALEYLADQKRFLDY